MGYYTILINTNADTNRARDNKGSSRRAARPASNQLGKMGEMSAHFIAKACPKYKWMTGTAYTSALYVCDCAKITQAMRTKLVTRQSLTMEQKGWEKNVRSLLFDGWVGVFVWLGNWWAGGVGGSGCFVGGRACAVAPPTDAYNLK